MANKVPVAELQTQFSSGEATPTPWAEGRTQLEKAQIYWLSTVRPDGRPHVTPLFAVWMDEAWYFCTGEGERKAKNIVHNPYCVVTTGCNVVEGLDVVVEGKAVRVSDDAKLQRIADEYVSKYEWRYTVRDGAFHDGDSTAIVYEVVPTKAFGFGKGKVFSQTRWRF